VPHLPGGAKLRSSAKLKLVPSEGVRRYVF